jgi:hypothetical protein
MVLWDKNWNFLWKYVREKKTVTKKERKIKNTRNSFSPNSGKYGLLAKRWKKKYFVSKTAVFRWKHSIKWRKTVQLHQKLIEES